MLTKFCIVYFSATPRVVQYHDGCTISWWLTVLVAFLGAIKFVTLSLQGHGPPSWILRTNHFYQSWLNKKNNKQQLAMSLLICSSAYKTVQGFCLWQFNELRFLQSFQKKFWLNLSHLILIFKDFFMQTALALLFDWNRITDKLINQKRTQITL